MVLIRQNCFTNKGATRFTKDSKATFEVFNSNLKLYAKTSDNRRFLIKTKNCFAHKGTQKVFNQRTQSKPLRYFIATLHFYAKTSTVEGFFD